MPGVPHSLKEQARSSRTHFAGALPCAITSRRCALSGALGAPQGCRGGVSASATLCVEPARLWLGVQAALRTSRAWLARRGRAGRARAACRAGWAHPAAPSASASHASRSRSTPLAGWPEASGAPSLKGEEPGGAGGGPATGVWGRAAWHLLPRGALGKEVAVDRALPPALSGATAPGVLGRQGVEQAGLQSGQPGRSPAPVAGALHAPAAVPQAGCTAGQPVAPGGGRSERSAWR